MPAHQLRGALDGVPDVEQAADQRLDPAQRPPLIGGEPVRQRPFPQFQLEPGPLLRAQPLPRHRAPGPQRLSPASLPGPVPPPHRPFSDPQVARDLIDLIAAGEPPGGLHPQLLTPLLLGGRVPAPLRVPHTPVIRPKPAHVTTLGSTSSVWLALPSPARRFAAEDLSRWLNFDGRNPQMAQKRWQWPRFVGTGHLSLHFVPDLDRPFRHPGCMISFKSVTPMHHPMCMGSSANCRSPSRCRA